MKNIAIFLAFILFVFAVVAILASSAFQTSTSIELKTNYEKEFGFVVVPMNLEHKQSSKIEHSFKIRNPNSEFLRFEPVMNSCSCLEFVVSPEAISPGSIGNVSLSFAHGFEEEYQTYFLVLRSNEEKPNDISFRIGAHIVPSIQVSQLWNEEVSFDRGENPSFQQTFTFSRDLNESHLKSVFEPSILSTSGVLLRTELENGAG